MWKKIQDGDNIYFRCFHRPKLKNNRVGPFCSTQLPVGSSTNIASLRGHCQSRHWRSILAKGVNSNLSGMKSIKSFLSPQSKKTQKSDATKDPTTLDAGEELASALAIGEDTTFDVGDEIDSAISIGKHNSEMDENMVTRCDGILFSDVPDIVFPPSYDFLQCYPIGIHSPAVQEQFKNYKGFVVPKWTFMPDGNIFHIHCTKQMHCELSQVQMTNSGRLACDVCYSLLHSPPLIKELKMSASGDYPNKLPDPLCPLLVMHMRRANYRNECDNLRLELLNHEKTFARNRSKISDQERLIFAIHNHDVPQLKRLLGVHLTNHRSISSFMEKLTRASDQMRVGHSSHRRKLVSKASRGKRRKHRHEEFGNFDDEY